MNKLFFIIGFLIPLPAYFSDSFAELIQNFGGNFWIIFSKLGFIFYPLYLIIFIVPLFVLIAWVTSIINNNLKFKKTFTRLFYGFAVSSAIFLLFALIAISQFQFSF